MRLAILALAGCFARQPEPQGPRVVCDGVAVGYAYSTECQQIPADRCWNDDSEECVAEAEERQEANRRAAGRERTALIVLGILAVGLVVAAVAAQ